MSTIKAFLTIFALTAVAGCASQPVEEIKGVFQRATEAITGKTAPDSESTGETGAEARDEGNGKDGKSAGVAGSQSGSMRAPELSAGIDAYENGKYGEASKILSSALPRLDKPDQVTALKYLAFIACTSGRKSQCRAEFRKALTLDPSFDLEPAEAGHPVWGPVFRSVKAKRRR